MHCEVNVIRGAYVWEGSEYLLELRSIKGHMVRCLLTPWKQTVEEEDCKPMFEGLPEIKGSPSPEDSDGSEERIMEYACLGSGIMT